MNINLEDVFKNAKMPPAPDFKSDGKDVGHRRTLIPRSQWGALPPIQTVDLPLPIKTVVFAYNTKRPPCLSEESCCQAMKEMQLLHMGKGLSDIYYNFCVGGDGAMYEGRGWTAKHSKMATFLRRKIDVGNCLVIGVIGDGQSDVDWRPPYELVAPGMRLVNKGVKEGKVIEHHNIMEEYELIEECTQPDC